MKKTAFLLILVSTLIGSSCGKFLENEVEAIDKKNTQEIAAYISQKNLQVQSSTTGLKYQITKTTPAKVAQAGEEVSFHYILSLLDGSKIDSSSRLKNEPGKIIFGTSNIILGFLEAISILKEGERGIFLLPSTLAFGSQANAAIPANANLRLDLEIMKIRTEDQVIEDYIKATKLLITETTASGLRFIRTAPGVGTELKTGMLTTVKYSGSSVRNGVQFNTGQIEVTLGVNPLVKGFEEGLLKMKVGEKATLVFPSKLGYGTTGSGTRIAPYTPLVFNVEIVSAK